MNTILIILGATIGLYLMIKVFQKPIWGIVGVFAALPLEPFMPELGGITLGRFIGVFAILSWLFNYIKDEKFRAPVQNSPIVFRVLLFGVCIMVSSTLWLFEIDGETAFSNGVTVFLLCIFTIMTQSLVTSNQSICYIGFGLAFASSIACIPGFLFSNGYDVYSFFGAEAPQDLTEESLRATNIGGSANELGIIARNGVYGALLFLFFSKGKSLRIINLGFLFICISALFLSGSRTNFFGVGMLVGFITLVVFFKYKGKKTKFLGPIFGGALILSLGWSLAPSLIKDRLFLGQENEHIAERAEVRKQFTVDQRLQAVDYLFEYPFSGVGLNRTNLMTGDYGAHDSFSVIVGETGMLGTISFLVLVIYALQALIKKVWKSSDIAKLLPLGLLLGALVSLLIMGVGGGLILIYDRTFYLTLGLISPICAGLLQGTFKANQKN